MSKGKRLAQELSLDVAQALYSDWGNFYAEITKYPCVLFDKNGYLLITNEEELHSNNIKVGKRTNVPQKISSMPNYIFTKSVVAKIAEEVTEDEFYEGSITKVTVNKYERDRRARAACLKHYGYNCYVCDVNLEIIYGNVAEKFIHVHHEIPISEIKAEYRVDPIKDLKPVCPNCHAIIHLKSPPYKISEIKKLMRENGGG